MSAKGNIFGQLSAYLDGELGEAEARRVEQAVAGNATLREELETLRAVRDLLRKLPPQRAPGDLASRVLAGAERGQLVGAEEAHLGEGAGRWVRYLSAAAVLLIAACVGTVVAITLWAPPPPRDGVAFRNPRGIVDVTADANEAANLEGALAAKKGGREEFGGHGTRPAPAPVGKGRAGAVDDHGRSLAIGNGLVQGKGVADLHRSLARAEADNEIIFTNHVALTRREVEKVLLANGIAPAAVRESGAAPKKARPHAARMNYYRANELSPRQVQFEAWVTREQMPKLQKEIGSLRERQNVSQAFAFAGPTDAPEGGAQRRGGWGIDAPDLAKRVADSQTGAGEAAGKGGTVEAKRSGGSQATPTPAPKPAPRPAVEPPAPTGPAIARAKLSPAGPRAPTARGQQLGQIAEQAVSTGRQGARREVPREGRDPRSAKEATAKPEAETEEVTKAEALGMKQVPAVVPGAPLGDVSPASRAAKPTGSPASTRSPGRRGRGRDTLRSGPAEHAKGPADDAAKGQVGQTFDKDSKAALAEKVPDRGASPKAPGPAAPRPKPTSRAAGGSTDQEAPVVEVKLAQGQKIQLRVPAEPNATVLAAGIGATDGRPRRPGESKGRTTTSRPATQPKGSEAIAKALDILSARYKADQAGMGKLAELSPAEAAERLARLGLGQATQQQLRAIQATSQYATARLRRLLITVNYRDRVEDARVRALMEELREREAARQADRARSADKR